ncbi:MAG: MCE family protein [Planctomycetes bacterium]|nr:MCE family protein [Planctomycetota bacterium]
MITRHLILGLVFIGALALVGWVTIFIGNRIFGKSGFESRVVFDNVGGLKEGDKVRFLGMEVGVVDSLNVDRRQGHVEVVFYTKEKFDEPDRYQYRVVQGSLFGNKVVEISPIESFGRERQGVEIAAPVAAPSPAAPAPGLSSSGRAEGMVETALSVAGPAVAGLPGATATTPAPAQTAPGRARLVLEFAAGSGLREECMLRYTGIPFGRVAGVEAVAAGTDRVTFEMFQELPNVKSRIYLLKREADGSAWVDLVGRLPVERAPRVADHTVGTRETEMGEAIHSLRTVADEIRITFARINDPEAGVVGRLVSDPGLGKAAGDLITTLSDSVKNKDTVLGKLLNDPEMGTKLQNIMSNLEKATGDLTAALGKDNPEGLVGRLLYDKTMGEKLDRIMTNLDKTMGNLTSDQSTLGLLMSKRDIYDELQSILRNVNATVEDVREQTPIVTFTGILFQAFQ